MKAYSIDLRQKIIEAYYSQPISQRQLALQWGLRPHHRGKNVSMIGAISIKEVVASVNLLGGTEAQAISTAFEQINELDMYNWFTHCCYCSSPT